jgi:hypothetical protein
VVRWSRLSGRDEVLAAHTTTRAHFSRNSEPSIVQIRPASQEGRKEGRKEGGSQRDESSIVLVAFEPSCLT